MELTINADRPALEVIKNGQTTRWEYDVVLLKLEADRIESKYELLGPDNRLEPLTPAAIVEFRDYLRTQGLEDCDADLAFRVYHLIRVQFAQLVHGLVAQVGK